MLFRKRRMKQDKAEQPNSENFNPESVPFPDDKPGAGHQCCGGHGHHGHGHGQGGCCGGHGHAHEEGEAHECQCEKDGGEKGGCGCQHGEEAHECGCGADEAVQAEILAKIDAIATENDKLRKMLASSISDFDNFRKRTLRDKDEARRNAIADFTGTLVPVLDTMALALGSARKHHPEASAVLDGIDMVMTQFKGVLKGQGVEEINPLGGNFDPNLHESIAHMPSADVPEGKVSAVARIGYTINGRLIRPATVVLSSGPAKAE
jgi:molecular chaperone GrpE (heat shock protein)